MKLATLVDTTRDGRLIVVDRAGTRFVDGAHVALNLQAALDDWERVQPALERLYHELCTTPALGSPLHVEQLAAPLPRAYEWVDGSAYLSHVVRVRKARGAEPPETLTSDPLVYQGGSGVLLGPRSQLALPNPAWGLDFEGEVCVVLGDTPRGTTAAEAGSSVRLLMLANDVTYRNLVPAELKKAFGFFCSKPATAFAPFAVTPDELGASFTDGRVRLPLECALNGHKVGENDASEMHFSFFDLIAHICQTRAFTAGTILGSGTVSNADEAHGVSCLAELRALETVAYGAPRTAYLKPGDHVRIEMHDHEGLSVFGAIDQEVVLT